MSLDISQTEREGIQILELSGGVTAGEGATTLRERLRGMAESGLTRVVLSLQDVNFIDSTGLGTLVICHTTLRKAGGALKLVNLSRRNIELLVLPKLASVFEIYGDEQDGVNSFFPGREFKKFDILGFTESGGR